MKGDDPKKVYADIIDLPYKKNPNFLIMRLRFSTESSV